MDILAPFYEKAVNFVSEMDWYYALPTLCVLAFSSVVVYCYFSSKSKANYIVKVRTGDRQGAGTNSDIQIIFRDAGVETKPYNLDNILRDDFERGQTDTFKLSVVENLNTLKEIELCFKVKGFLPDWYLDNIVVHDVHKNRDYIFPCHRWFRDSKSFVLAPYDSCLPQHSPHKEQRARELEEMREIYQYKQNAEGLHVQVKELPEAEGFSLGAKFDIQARKISLFLQTGVQKFIECIPVVDHRFKSLEDVKDLFKKFPSLEEPPGIHTWDNDVRFGNDRLNGTNPKLIQLCKSIPTNFAVDPESVQPFLEGLTLEVAIQENRIFLVDLKILEGIPTVNDTVLCTPFALFFQTKDQTLIPIAIQLFQQPSNDNPVFYPSDDAYLWLLVKMWYSNADATYHQSCVHLGSTHLEMEGISICTHRHLSPSHPVYKLLAPHFLYLIAINSRGLETLIAPGGWVDNTMTIGRDGMLVLMAKRHKTWELMGDGDFKEDLQRRGVLKDSVLPGYHYRDDGLLHYNAITTYVKKMLHLFYANADEIMNDTELQNWGAEMVAPVGKFGGPIGGLGLKGVPGNGQFSSHDQLLQLIRTIIFTCSVEHAAANFGQYDTYAFTPNYPAYLNGVPPTTKDPKTQDDIVHHLPDKTTILDTMMITKILSTRGTQSLGDFEEVYHHEPEAEKIVLEFQEELQRIGKEIRKKNEERKFPYTLLDSESVPNSISI